MDERIIIAVVFFLLGATIGIWFTVLTEGLI